MVVMLSSTKEEVSHCAMAVESNVELVAVIVGVKTQYTNQQFDSLCSEAKQQVPMAKMIIFFRVLLQEASLQAHSCARVWWCDSKFGIGSITMAILLLFKGHLDVSKEIKERRVYILLFFSSFFLFFLNVGEFIFF